MAVIKCKMCGGDIELSPDKTFGVCECCGSTMTFPKVDDDQRAAAFNRGNYFRRIGEFDKALAVYERIVEEDNTDAEAHWCYALCRYGIEYVEDPTSHEYLPTCHRASFDNFLEDVDYQAALQYSDGITKRQYEKDAAKIAEVQHGILATCQNEQPFDVFICYKESDENGSRTKDSTLAQEIYYQLTDQGRRVFFARITLEDKVGTEYEPYIFAALNSAKVMVVVGTKPEYFNAVWVKNEWSRFLAMMKKDRSKLLLPCYRDMDPYDLPEALSVLQSYDMSKIGFIQDLTRGINKVLDAGKQPASAPKETVVVQNVANTNVTAQIKRGNMALADGEWEQARTFFNQALDMDAECAEAYLGLALLEAHCGSLAALQKQQMDKIQAVQGTSIAVPFQNELQNTLNKTGAEYCNKVRELCDLPDMLSDMEKVFSYTNFQMQSALEEKQEAWKEIQKYYTNDRNMSKALRFAKGETAQQCKEYLSGLHKAAEELLENQKQHEQAEADEKKKLFTTFLSSATERADKILAANREKLEQTYQSAQEEQSKAQTVEDWKDAARQYASLGKYKDAPRQAELCIERQRILETEIHKKKNRFVCTVVAVAALAVTAFCVLTLVIIPNNKYRAAVALMEAGNYKDAISAFEAMNGYKDSEAQIGNCKYQQAVELMEAGNYKDAIFAFEAVGDYKDAILKKMNCWTQITVCETVSAGSANTVGLKSNGTVVAVGSNSSGQCDVNDWSDIVEVSAGLAYTVGLKSNGTVVAVGKNSSGRCDVSDWSDIVAVSAGGDNTVGLKSDGTVVAAGANQSGQRDVGGWSDIVAISAGLDYNVGLKSDGTVVTAGDNSYGQCDVSSWKDIVAVSAGYYHTVGLKSDGTVVAVGDNSYGQCDVSSWKDIVAVSAGTDNTVGLKSNGTIVAVGDNCYGQCDVSGWSDIVAISAEWQYTVGLKSDGTVVAVGRNEYGQSNVSDWTDIRLPDDNG